MTNEETRMKNGRSWRQSVLVSSLGSRHWALTPHSGFVIRHFLCAAILLTTSLSASAGTIRATIDSAEPVSQAWIIQRKDTNIGVENKPRSIKLTGNELVVEDLAVPGRYDLRFKMASGCVVEGWDGHVPESDYVEEQPLGKESKLTILKKMAKIEKRHFADKVIVLDIQGNIQNAAIIVAKLRTRPFVGGAYKKGEWVWRVERWQWEFPEEDTWVPYQERPYYALVRKRLYKKDYQALCTTYARHLGGIVLTDEQPEATMGVLKIPRLKPGTRALNPDGSTTRPIRIKPWQEPDLTEPDTPTADQQGAS